MEFRIGFARYKLSRIVSIMHCHQTNKFAFFCSSTDAFLENLILEERSKRETILLKYFENNPYKTLLPVITAPECCIRNETHCDLSQNATIQELVGSIETYIKGEKVPNTKLNCVLINFAKSGNIKGVKAVQYVVKKCNNSYFKSQSEYKHYLAEALWIDGKIDDSLKLFSDAYDNLQIQPTVKLMLKCLFPLLIIRHSEGMLCKTVLFFEQFSVEKDDHILLAYLWKELFQSDWYSDQHLAKQIIKKNIHLLQVVKWMIPSMGKDFLKNHKIDHFYRLIEFTLENGLKPFDGTLIRLLFDYYYIHQNIERCSVVVKYSTSFDATLTEDQQRRYINLLLKSKNSVSSKQNIKKPQNLTFKF